MARTLENRVAFVTGAASGIGLKIAESFAREGARVCIADLDAAAAEAAAASIQGGGGQAIGARCDVTRDADLATAFDATLAAWGRIDILVNNAGLGPENAAEDVTEADFDFTCAVNLKGTFFVSQAVGRAMIRQGGGTIVNLGSQAGEVALPGEAVYCMTKAAIHHLTRCLAVEWGVHGITVNAVAPTFIVTPGTAPALEDPVFLADVLERIAGLHRVGQPMDVAGAVVFLASPAASLITGHTMLIDGGWTVR